MKHKIKGYVCMLFADMQDYWTSFKREIIEKDNKRDRNFQKQFLSAPWHKHNYNNLFTMFCFIYTI